MTTSLIERYWNPDEPHLKERSFYARLFDYGCAVSDFTFHDLHPELWTPEEKEDIFTHWRNAFKTMMLFHVSMDKEASKRMLDAFFSGPEGLRRLEETKPRFPPLSCNAVVQHLRTLQPTWTPEYSSAWLSTPGFNDKVIKTMAACVDGTSDLMAHIKPLLYANKRHTPITLLQYAQVRILCGLMQQQQLIDESPKWNVSCTQVQKKRLEMCAIQTLKQAKKIPPRYTKALHYFEITYQRPLGSQPNDTLELLLPFCVQVPTSEHEIDLLM